ncbi:ParB/RepB/Spo0J family partition protein [Dermabacter sp. HSID17554]|uniref:ParB/RepB/Spo0J family partition protein n=1 Tax=Dermabacter sp. HSID17554 TaxID=2419511 RepID=UPI000F88533F|nr:ParB/RepB/Spo0J family partition protein [Dermabacter sp. HSID17554]RUP86437.1 ParB/RepB/Spo0J family partition protein [Dermabacter sp. HSID17554]
MAKKRGLGRGIGALIPSSEPASSEKSEAPEAKSPEPSATSTEPPSPSKKDSDASPAPTEAEVAQSTSAGTRGVDMFFSSDDSSTAEARERRKAADLELADSWARDARSKRRGGKKPAAKTATSRVGAEKPAEKGDKTRATQPSGPAPTAEAPAAAAPTAEQPATPGNAPANAAAQAGLVPVPGAEFVEVPIAEIRENPRNPRTVFDDDELDELAYSLREVGVLQPIVVRPVTDSVDGESFEIVMGERRWRAAKRAGLDSIPAIVRSTADDDLLRDALLENLHRSQLNPLEEAAAYGQLLEDFNCTQDELADRIGRSRPQISNTLRLLRLPPLVQRRLQSGALSAGHARALLGLDDVQLQEELAQRIVSEGLSVRAVERLIANGVESSTATRAVPRRSSYNPRVVSLTSQLSTKLEAPVRIDVGKRKGKVTLEFMNLDDLERIVQKLGLDDVEIPEA